MAVQAKAKGNGPATGMAKTPAPDEVSSIRSPTGQGYGSNGPTGNASSVDPGKRVLSTLAANLESSVDDDGVLARIIKEGTARQDDSITGQLRSIADSNVPDAFGMSRRQAGDGSPGGTIPATIGASAAQPPRSPDDAS